MSCSSCGTSPSANKYKSPLECPSRMEDGRAFTDYRPRCAVNYELFEQVNAAKMIKSSYESRMFLQHNADRVLEYERQKSIDNLIPCAPCTRPFSDPGTMLPEKYIVRCNGVSCVREEVNPYGLGDGRKY